MCGSLTSLCNRVDYSILIGRSYDKDLARVEAERQRDSHGPDPRARPCAVVTSMCAQLVGSSYRVLHSHRPGVVVKVVASRSPG